MRTRTRPGTPGGAVGVGAAFLLLAAVTALGQTGGGYSLAWSTIDGGGGAAGTGGGYSLSGTIGQPDAGVLTGGPYVLQGGFWGGGPLATSVSNPATPPGSDPQALPRVLRLYPSVPNPFNPRTSIAFDLPRPGPVSLEIFNLRGQRVCTLLQGERVAGHHRVVWEGLDDRGAAVASGSYVVQLATRDAVRREKLVLVR